MRLGPRLLAGVAALCLFASTDALFRRALATPRDEVSITIGPGGWKPARVETHRGGQLRLRLSAEAGEHCFAIDALRVERRVVAGRETSVDIVPDKAGSFPFYDCLSSEGRRVTGTLVVTD